MSLIPPGSVSIVHAAQDAIDSLTTLSEIFRRPSGGQEHERASSKPGDEIERLEVWIREHHVRSGELDHSLREASQLRDRVLSLLARLLGTVDRRLHHNMQSPG